MVNLTAGVKKLAPPMFIIFVFSKVLIGLGFGVLLAQYLAPYVWWLVTVGIVLSIVCVISALKNV